MRASTKLLRSFHGWCHAICPLCGILFAISAMAASPSSSVRRWTSYPAETVFQHMTMARDLSQSTVCCMLQDSRGRLWFGTDNGLNLYDGNRFKVFRHRAGQEDTLGADWVTCLLEDPRGYLWVGTLAGGLSRIDLSTLAVHSTFHDPAPVPSNDISDLLLDREGNLWVGTQNGLFMLPAACMPPAPQRFVTFTKRPEDPRGLPNPFVSSLLEDRQGTIWVASAFQGVCRVVKDRGSERITFGLFDADPAKPDARPPQRTSFMVEDTHGVIWLGHGQELYGYYPGSGGVFRRYAPGPGGKHNLESGSIMHFYRDRQGTIWVATDGGGLNRMLPREHPHDAPQFQAYKHQAMDLDSLGGNCVWSIYQDRSGVLWVGTYQTGLNKLQLGHGAAMKTSVAKYSRKPLDPHSLSGDLVNAILEDHEGNLWIGTDGAGLDRVVPPGNPDDALRFEHFRAGSSNAGALKDDVITALYEDSKHRLWAGTYQGGLIRIDFPSGSTSGPPRFVYYRNRQGDPSSLGGNFVTSMLEDSRKRFWITTISGLSRFYPEKGAFEQYQADPKTGLSSNAIYSVAEDRYGTLWLGSHPGLNRFNPETGKAKVYLPGKGPGAISHEIAYAVLVDASGTLWVGTNGGLDQASVPPWDGPEPSFTSYGTADGLPSDVVRGITQDTKGRLWLSTNHTLCRFDPKEGRGHPFPWRTEIAGNEYIRNSHQVFRSGEVAFGGIRGFCIFDPEDILGGTQVSPVSITDLRISGKSVPVGASISGRVLLDRAIPELKEITLTSREYEFTLEFATFNYVFPERNQYAYMMEGLDRVWTFCGNQHSATYTTLPPGDYVFRVKAANCDGFWNEVGTSLKIHVLPPWWMQWWFRGLMIALLAGVIYVIVRMRLKVLHARNRILKEIVDARTRELAEANVALRDQSLTDPLTGLRNRRFLYACMPEDVAQVQRVQRDAVINGERMKLNIDVLIIMADIDHFKQVNDRYGHHAGDMVLQQMSVILQNAVRGSDTVARWGGEEFLIVARNSARADATILPERIRSAMESHRFEIGEAEPIRCTCSLGFSVFPFLPNATSLFTWEQIVDLADACLYAAKRSGRNAWVGLIPDTTEDVEKLKARVPGTVSELAKSGLFRPTTSFKEPVRWDD